MRQSNKMKKVAIVTGASSGIGKAIAYTLVSKNYIVYDFSRREQKDSTVSHMVVDVTDEQAVVRAVRSIMKQEGHIDLLVCNAGFGISGAVEFTSSEEAHKQMEVNLFGVDHCVRAVLPYMRHHKRGRIVCVSSVAGIIPIPFQTWYSVSKAAIVAYVQGLQNEVRPFHISVCAVLPGDIKTGFTHARQKSLKGNDIYRGRIARSVARMEKDEQNGMLPEVAGAMIAELAMQKHTKPVISIGFAYKAAAMAVKLLPCRIAGFIVYILYGR